MTHILCLRALGLGDFLTGVPALRLIRRARPDAHLTLAAPERFGVLARRAGLVDAVADYDGLRSLDPLPRLPDRPDVAIDLHGNGPASRAVLRATGAPVVVAYAVDPGPGNTAVWDPEEHEVARWIRLVATGLGIDGHPADGIAGSLPRPELPGSLPTGAVVVHPGASAGSRRWPAERFVTVARQLRDLGRPVVVTGSGAERPLAEAVACAAGAVPLTLLPLEDLLALVGRARLVVSNDTGVAHAASTYATPSVVLFGPVPPSRWGPPTTPIHRALHLPATGDPVGDPHGTSVDPALLRIQPEQVLDACRAVCAVADEQQAA